MDALGSLFDELKNNGSVEGNFQGFLHALIGRAIVRVADNVVISRGLTWREMAPKYLGQWTAR